MGFTRYWSGDYSITPDLVKDVKAIIRNSNVSIKGPVGVDQAIITTEKIQFNGSKSLDEDYETFTLALTDEDWKFCKTRRMPYDEVVTAVLLRVTHYNPEFSSEVDGDWANDCKPGRELYELTFGETPAKPRDMVESYS